MVLDGKKQFFLVITTNIQYLFFAYFECVLHGKIVQIKKRWIVHLETNWVMNLLGLTVNSHKHKLKRVIIFSLIIYLVIGIKLYIKMVKKI
jgi:hypothetical protein